MNRITITKVFNLIRKVGKLTMLVISIFVFAVAILLQIEYEDYVSESLRLINDPVIKERRCYIPALVFEFNRIALDTEYKAASVGRILSDQYRTSAVRHKDAYFAKCYLTEAEIDSIYNEIQMRLNSRR